MKKILFILTGLVAVLSACENQDWGFPDYDYQTVYFAYQYPVRTITLGEDIFDTSLDNEHKCLISATTGGVYSNPNDIVIDFSVDNGIAEDLIFGGTSDSIRIMPSTYYSLESDQIVIPQGQLTGGVEVQLTDAFFADPLSLRNTYVIPMQITGITSADSVLSGVPLVENPRKAVSGDWSVQPKDFVLYAVKYINEWHGYYLRRGRDVIVGKGGNTALDTTIVRHAEYVERDEVNFLTTESLSTTAFPLVFKDSLENDIPVTLLLNFDDAGNCTISSNDYPATGSGQFVPKGEENSWGNQDRDVLYLSYQIDLPETDVTAMDTLVMRNRGVDIELFTPAAN